MKKNIIITQDHLKTWAQTPVEKRMTFTDASTPGFQVWREVSDKIAFRYRYRSPVTGKRHTLTLGEYPAMTLGEARIEAISLGMIVSRGSDPKFEAANISVDLSLGQLLEKMVALDGALFRKTCGREGLSPRTCRDYLSYKRNHYGDLNDVSVSYLQNNPHVLHNHIAGIRNRVSPHRARLVRVSMSSAISWGIESGLLSIQTNPAFQQIRARRKRSSKGSIQRFLDRNELKFLLNELDSEIAGKTVTRKNGQVLTATMVKLQLLTGARPSEVAGALTDEFDLYSDIPVWTISGFRAYSWEGEEFIRRTKNGKTHTIPLPPQAIEAVRDAQGVTGWSPWLFPVRRLTGTLPKKPFMDPPKGILHRIHKKSLDARIGKPEPIAPHSLRRTMATMIEETGIADPSLISRILNHTVDDVTHKHYLHSKNLERIRTVLQRWANWLDRLKNGQEEKVLDIAKYKVG